jgi:hypothetical protein
MIDAATVRGDMMRKTVLLVALLFLGVSMTAWTAAYGADRDSAPTPDGNSQTPLIAHFDINDLRLGLPRAELNKELDLDCDPVKCTYFPSDSPRADAPRATELRYFAGIAASNYVFHFNQQKLVEIDVCFPVDRFDAVAQALAQRYGPAGSKQVYGYANTPKGDVTQQKLLWKADNGDHLGVAGYSNDWDHSCVTLTNPALPKSRVRRHPPSRRRRVVSSGCSR